MLMLQALRMEIRLAVSLSYQLTLAFLLLKMGGGGGGPGAEGLSAQQDERTGCIRVFYLAVRKNSPSGKSGQG